MKQPSMKYNLKPLVSTNLQSGLINTTKLFARFFSKIAFGPTVGFKRHQVLILRTLRCNQNTRNAFTCLNKYSLGYQYSGNVHLTLIQNFQICRIHRNIDLKMMAVNFRGLHMAKSPRTLTFHSRESSTF